MCTLLLIPVQRSHAGPITVIITETVKKVLKAMDLAVQRLQNEIIKLQNAQKALENLMSKLKLREISEWGEKQRSLFAGYYEELWKIKSAISSYKRVRDIVRQQVQLVKEYRRAVKVLSNARCFNPEEITYMLEVYSGILKHSIQNVDQIYIVVRNFSLQLTDAQRLEQIHQLAGAIQKNLNDLRSFTNQNVVFGIQRSKDDTELATIKGLYNVE